MPRAKGGSIPPPRVHVHPGHGGSISDLNEHDVLSGRGGRINNHPGNIMFRTVVEDYKREYLDPRTRKLEKAHVAARLVGQIRSLNPPGRFLKEDPDNPGNFIEIGDQKAWKKAGQALREDAPDVRKEIDEELETTEKQVKGRPVPPHQQQRPPHHQQHQHPHHRPSVPHGIPPSVSYSPTSAPMPLAPPSSGGGGARPDPPEATGVTGYRQPPLRYQGNKRYFESGRGGRMVGGRFPGRGGGRGHPPSPHHHPQQQQHPQQVHSQGGYHHQNFYNHPPPPQSMTPPPQHYSHPGPQFQHDKFQQHPHPHAPHSAPPQFQQQPHYQNHPHQYHPNQPPPGYAPPPQPQFTAHDGKHGKKSSKSASPIPPIVGAVAHGVHQTMDSLSGLTNKVKNRRGLAVPSSIKGSRESAGSEFPRHTSVATDFTMSDVSTLGDSRTALPQERNNTVGTFDASMKASGAMLGKSALLGIFDESMGSLMPPPTDEAPKPYHQQEVALTGDAEKQPRMTGAAAGAGGGDDPNKQSTGTTSSSSKSRDGESFTMSDLMGSGFSLGQLGRTRSFPDLMLSTGDLLPPLQSDSEREEKDSQGPQTRTSSSSSNREGVLLKPFHRHSSSESSTGGNMGGFHPVRGRSNAGHNVPGLNDAMSIMSLDSRKSLKSESSSWLENFRSMQSIHSDMNPWEASSGRSLSRRNGEMIMNDGSDGSVRSFLSDVSTELNALDLAEPLLPPIDADGGLNDSDFMGVARPDP